MARASFTIKEVETALESVYSGDISSKLAWIISVATNSHKISVETAMAQGIKITITDIIRGMSNCYCKYEYILDVLGTLDANQRKSNSRRSSKK